MKKKLVGLFLSMVLVLSAVPSLAASELMVSTGAATGDSNNMWLWIGIGAAAVLLAVILVIVKLRSNKANKAE